MSSIVSDHSRQKSATFRNWTVTFLVGALLMAATGCGAVAHLENADGVRLYQQGYYDAAQKRFQQALYNAPDAPDAYYNIAATYHQLGKQNQDQELLAQAEQYYNQCLDRHPNHRECYRGLSVLMSEDGRSEEAFALLEGWVDHAPSLPDPRIELARLYEEYGDQESAKAQLVEALHTDPQNATVLAALGRIRESLGEHQQALSDYQRSLSADGMQEEVKARVVALQTALSPSMLTAPGADTRVVTRNALPPR